MWQPLVNHEPLRSSSGLWFDLQASWMKKVFSITESPTEDKRVDSSSTKESILNILLALVTNDRCTDSNEVMCYMFLQELMREKALYSIYEDGLEPLD